MMIAWEEVERLLRKYSPKLQIEYRLLILTDETSTIDYAPEEVKEWSENVNKSLKRIGKFYRNYKNNITLEVRKYASVPVIHGWYVREPFISWYVSCCRWTKRDSYWNYYWGGDDYSLVRDATTDPLYQDWANIFDGYFNYLWEKAGTSVDLTNV